MAAELNAEDSSYFFDLGNLFNEENVEIEQLDGDYVQDSELNDLMNSVQQNAQIIDENQAPTASVAADTKTELSTKSSRFLKLTEDEIDKSSW